jgi:NhaP-type Na+/H+ or K+/H+ antiporter
VKLGEGRARTLTLAVSTNSLLLGIGLVLVLAVGSQLLAKSLRLPAIVVLLPVGFIAGILTDDVHPSDLLGSLFQPFVSVAVGVILFEAGLRLSFRDVTPRIRTVVIRLVSVGLVLTWLAVAGATALLFSGLGSDVPLLIGAILVVSGPTVVLPLLAHIRPMRDVRSVLKWEGVLIDPLGALLGVIVFGVAQTGGSNGWHPGAMILSIVVGAAVGAIGAGILWALLPRVQRLAPRQVIPVILALTVAALVAADLIREDTGFLATLLMGAFLANQRSIDVADAVEFHETLVALLIGVLFVLIAASVSPSEVRHVLAGSLALVAIMILVIRPTVVALSALGSKLDNRERAFVAWMAPRGIVAGSTASAFGLELASAHIQGANKILPIVFVVIFGTVVVYGLTGPLVGRRLGIAGAHRTFVLIVGGHPPARAIGSALQAAGVGVRLWAGPAAAQEAARAAGLEAGRGRILVDSLNREAELEEITDALLLSRSDDFNALAAPELRADLGHGHVYRIAPDPDEPDLLPPATGHDILGSEHLTLADLTRRLGDGARLQRTTAGHGNGAEFRADASVLFVIGSGGGLRAATDADRPTIHQGDTVISLVSGE